MQTDSLDGLDTVMTSASPPQPSPILQSSSTSMPAGTPQLRLYARQNYPSTIEMPSSSMNYTPAPRPLRRSASFTDTTRSLPPPSYTTLASSTTQPQPPGLMQPAIRHRLQALAALQSVTTPPQYSPIQSTPSNAPDQRPAFADPFLDTSTDSLPAYDSFFDGLHLPLPPSDPTSYKDFFKSTPLPSSNTTSINSPQSIATPSPSLPNRAFRTTLTKQNDFSRFGSFSSSDDFRMGFHPSSKPKSPPPEPPAKRRKEPDPNSPPKP